MKKNDEKNVKSKLIKQENEANDQIKKFIIILIGVALICFLAYIFTSKVLVGDDKKDNTTADVTISYDSIRVGNIFNRPYNKYYVLAYDLSDSSAGYYQNLLSSYQSKESKDKLYYIDLSLNVNKKYMGKGNNSAKNVDEISLKNPTLIQIKEGKIINYYDTKQSITSALS